MSEAARWRQDDTRREPKLAVPVSDPVGSDPLAELARLVGHDDPFRHMFRAAPVRAAPGPSGHTAGAEPPVDHRDVGVHHDALETDAHHPDQAWAADHHDQAREHVESDYSPTDEDAHRRDPDYDDGYWTDHTDHPDGAGIADVGFDPHQPSAADIPDLWAQGQDGHLTDAPVGAESSDAAATPHFDRSGARRPLVVLGAVLLLTGGGLAATFLAKGSAVPGVTGTIRTAPTIMAPTGAVKVKLDDGAATAPEDRDAALLNKNAIPVTGPVKVVTSQEQPVDLAQLHKPTDLADGARPIPTPSSPFPEPKKVKTFVVHPDGTMLTSDGSAVQSAPPQSAAPAGPTPAASAAAGTPVTTPRAAAGGTTPAAQTPATPTIASLAADPAVGDPAVKARPPTSAPVPVRGRAPVKRTDSAPTPSSGGGFGLQLAAAPSETEASAAFARLKKKYPAELGPHKAAIVKSDSGDKTVYRVRVGGLSQEEAKTLCSQLQAGGGDCFVVHN